jgi:hypothetical protein
VYVGYFDKKRKGVWVWLTSSAGIFALVCSGYDVDAGASACFVEHDFAVDEGVNRVIPTEADIFAGVVFGAALSDEDAACFDVLAAEAFYAQTLADAVASVFDTALTFFVCHTSLSFDGGDFDFGEFLSVADGAVVTFAAFEFEGDDFVAFDLVENFT